MWISKQEYENLKQRAIDAEERLFHSEYRERHLNDLIWDLRAEKDKKTEEKEMAYSKWAIFYKDGSVKTINAYDFDWDDEDETLSFTDDNDNMIACFKLDEIDGVSIVQDNAVIGVEQPLTLQLPAPKTKEVEIPAKPIIINDPVDPVKTPEWFPSPWTPSDPWWRNPQVTWNNADTAPLVERGTE